jgi:ABC-type sugar transport system ATPase subunit
VSEIALQQVAKSYQAGTAALVAIDLEIEVGERLVVLGPSGSGKSTLLRLIAGLETPSSGRILIKGRDVRDVPPHRRDIAMVFQHPALYPHLDVFDNLAFGLKARGVATADRRRRVHEIAGLLGLERLLDRRPSALSGGERQRVALGRAVVRNPRILLLDEPFSSLDGPLRASLRDEVFKLHQRFGSTLVHVTHDQAEALGMGQRIAVLDRGRLMQVGSPQEVYDHPAHRSVASFVGSPGMNLLPCELKYHQGCVEVKVLSDEDQQTLLLAKEIPELEGLARSMSQRVELGIRAESVELRMSGIGAGPLDDRAVLSGVIRRVEFQGDSRLVSLDIGGLPVLARSLASSFPAAAEGQRVEVSLDLDRVSWFDPETGRRWEPSLAEVDWTR